MIKQIKQSILSWIVFSWTVLLSYVWFAAYTNLPTQINNTTLTADIWNEVITTVNNIWNTQLWVDQTRQDVTGQRISWTTYTNNTWKPIVLNIHLNSWANWVINNLYVDWISIWAVRNEWGTVWIFWTMTAIIPNWSSYYATLPWTSLRWLELR